MIKKLSLPGFMLAAALAFLGAPDSRIAAAECGGPGEVLCKENEACAGILWFRQCTTTFDYYQTDDEMNTDPVGPGTVH